MHFVTIAISKGLHFLCTKEMFRISKNEERAKRYRRMRKETGKNLVTLLAASVTKAIEGDFIVMHHLGNKKINLNLSCKQQVFAARDINMKTKINSRPAS